MLVKWREFVGSNTSLRCHLEWAWTRFFRLLACCSGRLIITLYLNVSWAIFFPTLQALVVPLFWEINVSCSCRGNIDYRCVGGRFPVSASCVTISNPESLSSCKTEVNPEKKKKLKRAIIWMSLMLENNQLYLFHQEVKRWDPTTWFEICQFQTPSLKTVFSKASPCWTVCFWGYGERGSQGLSNGTNVASNSPTVLLYLHIYSPCSNCWPQQEQVNWIQNEKLVRVSEAEIPQVVSFSSYIFMILF